VTETELVQKIIAYVKNSGGDAWHVHGSAVQRAGEPDIDGWMPIGPFCIHFKVEVKIGDNQASAIQEVRLDMYRLGGYAVGVVRSVNEFQDLIRHAYLDGLYVRLNH